MSKELEYLLEIQQQLEELTERVDEMINCVLQTEGEKE